MPTLPTIVPGGHALFQRMFTRLNCDGRPPRFRVEFYPYSSLTLTIRRREETVHVRFSDLLHRASLPVLEGAGALLPRLPTQGPKTPRHSLSRLCAFPPHPHPHQSHAPPPHPSSDTTTRPS